ncbi:hypothetical protein DM01DRAFT_245569, partial [Hesseltinella vesiculosa]
HFFFTCPHRATVWIECWKLIFDVPSPSLDGIQASVLSFNWPPLNTHLMAVPPSLIVSTIIVSLWRAHWATIFDSSPFFPHCVVSSITRNISTL